MEPVEMILPTAAEAIRQRIGELRFAARELEDILVITGDLEPEDEEEDRAGGRETSGPEGGADLDAGGPPAPKARAARAAPTAGAPARENAAAPDIERRQRQVRIVGDTPPRSVLICRHCAKCKVNRPRGLCWSCYYTPGVRELYPSTSKYARRGTPNYTGPRPLPEPTATAPGTPERMAVLGQRARDGLALFHPGDRTEH